jgi:NADPH-dependent 2,4-dienoyl-CoA reductase/sulfur reductase-like enzyme
MMTQNKIQTEMLIIGGSDAGISAALRARELNKTIKITMILADDYPNLSICGIPYAVSGEVPAWQNLAHRTVEDLKAYDIQFFMSTRAKNINAEAHEVRALGADGHELLFGYNQLMIGTGAVPKEIPLTETAQGVHVLHTMGDFFKIQADLADNNVQHAAIIGAGYVGIEMAEAITRLGIQVSLFQRGPEVLSTLDSDMAIPVGDALRRNGVNVITNATITGVTGQIGAYQLAGNSVPTETFDFVLAVVGVQPNSDLLVDAGAKVNEIGAVIVNDRMQTSLADVYAAGDLVETKHRLLGNVYLPLGTTSHKQGRVAGANIAGGKATFAGVVGSQVLRAFDLFAARTGILAKEAVAAGYKVVEHTAVVDDHKGYYPGAEKITIRVIADAEMHQLLGAQLVGAYGSEVAKRADIFATAIYNGMTIESFSDLDLTYSPVVGAPWDAVQAAVQQLELKLLSE